MSFKEGRDMAFQFHVSWLYIIWEKGIKSKDIFASLISQVMDPYAQFHQDQGVLIHSNGTESQMDSDIENLIVMINADRPKKKARGPTQMQSVWGRRESEGPLHLSCNEFGQTTDEIGQGLSSFMGSMTRDGKITALDYES